MFVSKHSQLEVGYAVQNCRVILKRNCCRPAVCFGVLLRYFSYSAHCSNFRSVSGLHCEVWFDIWITLPYIVCSWGKQLHGFANLQKKGQRSKHLKWMSNKISSVTGFTLWASLKSYAHRGWVDRLISEEAIYWFIARGFGQMLVLYRSSTGFLNSSVLYKINSGKMVTLFFCTVVVPFRSPIFFSLLFSLLWNTGPEL